MVVLIYLIVAPFRNIKTLHHYHTYQRPDEFRSALLELFTDVEDVNLSLQVHHVQNAQHRQGDSTQVSAIPKATWQTKIYSCG